jgi:hypothetical protein
MTGLDTRYVTADWLRAALFGRWEAPAAAAKLDFAALETYNLILELFQTRPLRDSWALGAARAALHSTRDGGSCKP